MKMLVCLPCSPRSIPLPVSHWELWVPFFTHQMGLTWGRGQAGRIFLGIAALSCCQGEPQDPLQGSTWQAGSVFILSVATPGLVQPPLAGRAGARCPGCQMELEPALLRQLQLAALGLISHRAPGRLQCSGQHRCLPQGCCCFLTGFGEGGLGKCLGCSLEHPNTGGTPCRGSDQLPSILACHPAPNAMAAAWTPPGIGPGTHSSTVVRFALIQRVFGPE